MSGNKIKIVQPKINNLDEIFTLWQEEYDYHHNLDSVYYISTIKASSDKFRKYLESAIVNKQPHIRVAKAEGKIVGFTTFRKSPADYLDTNIQECGEVLEMYVYQKFRGRGIGKALLENAEKHFKNHGLKFVKLQVSTFNHNALKFYEIAGYKNRLSLLFKELK